LNDWGNEMNIAFSPLLPLPLIAVLALAAALLVGWSLFRRMRGALLRALALAALVLALANPVANFEEREPVTSIVAIVVDRSPSQMSMDRTARTDAALKALTERLARYPVLRNPDHRGGHRSRRAIALHPAVRGSGLGHPRCPELASRRRRDDHRRPGPRRAGRACRTSVLMHRCTA
jgi:hypothetical protein